MRTRLSRNFINPYLGILSIASFVLITSLILGYFINLKNYLNNETIFANSEVLASSSSFGNALQFNGSGIQDGDRIKIPVKNTVANIGATDITLEFWINATTSNNKSSSCTEGEDRWINGNIIIDRDIFNTPSFGDFGISLYGGRIAFGVHNGSTGMSICSTTSVADGQWHHVAVTRRLSDGMMSIFIDGVASRTFDGPNGNISYNNSRTGAFTNDPFLVIGAEKHDYDPSTYPSYTGSFDEFRVSNTIRYTSNFTRPGAPFIADNSTVGLYHFDETGTPTSILDTTGNVNGQVKYYNNFPKFIVSTIPATNLPLPTNTPSALPVPTSTPISTPVPTNRPTATPTVTPTSPSNQTPTPSSNTNSFLRFDGTNDVMTGRDIPVLTTYTIEGWVRRIRDRNTYETIMSDANSSYSNAMLSIYVDGGNYDCPGVTDQFAFYQRNPDQVQCSGVSAVVNQWFHISVSRDTNGTRRFFINGNVTSTQNNATNGANSTGLFSLGRAGSSNSEFFAGDIDEVHLTSSQKYVQNFVPSSNLTQDSGSIFLYKMSNTSGQSITDNSGNNRTGILGTTTATQSSDPTWQQGTIQ